MFLGLPLQLVEPIVRILLDRLVRMPSELIEAESQNLERHPPRPVQQPHLSLDGIGLAFLQMGVTPQLRARRRVNPELIDMSRYVDSLFTGFHRSAGYSRSESLQTSIKNRRMTLIGVEPSRRTIGHPHFTQHIFVVSPQLRDALEKCAILNAALAQSRVIIPTGDFLRAA